jgi:iron complex transport system substrate-binding protein
MNVQGGRQQNVLDDNRRVRVALSTVAIAFVCLLSAPSTQTRFVDDAGRSVSLPAHIGRVFAAGGPAEVMLYTLVPDFLVGRNRVPSADALEFYPPRYRQPVVITQLPEVDRPEADVEVIALAPDVYIEYGMVDDDYIAAVEAVQRRTRVPGIILNGELSRIPVMYRRLGAALGVEDRGARLGTVAERILSKHRGALASGGAPVRVYVSCSNDGQVPCFADESSGEVLEWLGGVNVAGTRATSPRRALTIAEIAALAPDLIVVNQSAPAFRRNAEWRRVKAAADGRVYQWPSLPNGWGSRPLSVNRLPGVAWLAYVARGRTFDTELETDIRLLFRELYHVELTDEQLQTLLAPI